MSIETLLEAAKFLELQAQQQQKAREENELRERLHLEQLADRRPSKPHYTSSSLGVPVSHVGRPGEPQPAPPLPPSCVPITVVPIPVLTANHGGLLSAPAPAPAPQLPPELLLPQPKTERMSPNHKLQGHAPHPHTPQITSQPANANKLQPPSPQQLLQCYPGSVVPGPQQHSLFPQTGPPPPSQVLLQHSPISRGSPPDDSPHLDNKKRPGGAGTRDVHNKLEKNRRAHLKECFEILKKNIPNVDEKKTSNLSVLRSALRYIQTLKRKEKEYEHEMERLAREKIATQQRLADLKNDLSQWMDVMEMERVLQQTVQPEEDQVSTSTASEGEEVLDDHLGDGVLPTAPPAVQPELLKTLPPPHCPSSHLHVSAQLVASPADPLYPALTLPQLLATPPATPIQTLLSARTHGHLVSGPGLQPTVIARASATHASVIQAVSHVIQAGGPKHLAHLAPCPHPSTTTAASSVHLAPGHPPIGHITVHPVAHLGPHLGPHLGQHLPTLYPQPVAVTQAAMVSHIAHTFAHHHVNGHVSSGPPAAAPVGKQQQQAVGVGAQMVAHHPQLVGQAVLNPVTMVTMPPFPVSTLKLA